MIVLRLENVHNRFANAFSWKISSTRSKANLVLGVEELLFVGMFVIICFDLLKVLFVAVSLCCELI